MKILTFLTIIFYSFNLYADNSIFLKKNDLAPFSGFLIPEETANKLYEQNHEYKILEQKNTINEKIIENKENQINLLNQDNKNLSAAMMDSQKKQQLVLGLTIAGVVIGMVLITFAVGYAIKTTQNIEIKSTTSNLPGINF